MALTRSCACMSRSSAHTGCSFSSMMKQGVSVGRYKLCSGLEAMGPGYEGMHMSRKAEVYRERV